jgi:hypothetical protein
MPEIPELAELDGLIRALIKQADGRSKRQLGSLPRKSERAHDQAQEALDLLEHVMLPRIR